MKLIMTCRHCKHLNNCLFESLHEQSTCAGVYLQQGTCTCNSVRINIQCVYGQLTRFLDQKCTNEHSLINGKMVV